MQPNTDVSYDINSDYGQLPVPRAVGSSYQKRSGQLPDYLRERMVQNNGVPRKNQIKASFEDRTMTYGRKLHNAIYERNRYGLPSRSPPRKTSAHGGYGMKRKVGVDNYASQPNLQFHKRNNGLDLKNSPYVKAAQRRSPAEAYTSPPALRLLKRKMEENSQG